MRVPVSRRRPSLRLGALPVGDGSPIGGLGLHGELALCGPHPLALRELAATGVIAAILARGA
jgi:hypothetical protein